MQAFPQRAQQRPDGRRVAKRHHFEIQNDAAKAIRFHEGDRVGDKACTRRGITHQVRHALTRKGTSPAVHIGNHGEHAGLLRDGQAMYERQHARVGAPLQRQIIGAQKAPLRDQPVKCPCMLYERLIGVVVPIHEEGGMQRC